MRPTAQTWIAAAAVAGLLAACQQEAEPPPVAPVEPTPAPVPPVPAVTYACDSGQTVSVRYPDSATALVRYQNAETTLRIGPAAIGARYQGDGLEWRIENREGEESGVLSRLGVGPGAGATVLERCARPSGAPGPANPPADPGMPAPCKGPALRLSREGGDAGAGNRNVTLGLQNVGSSACLLNGYPGLTLEDARGRALSQVRIESTGSDYFRQGGGPAPVVIQPQAKAFFDLAYSAVPHENIGETTCPSAARVQATAPGDTARIPLDIELSPCGRRIRVSPIRGVAEPEAATAAQVSST